MINKQDEDFYLLDLERTLGCGVPYYWNGNKHGYTTEISFAGLFSHWVAEQIVEGDYDHKTVMIPESVVFKILGKDMKPHAGTTIRSTT